ncbi:MAG: nitroreductase family protein [Micrococcales bacterium]|nr:nitroreductase family protein [Micrococcales bacterium]
MSTVDELRARKSVRVFEPTPIPAEVRQEILAGTFAAPTAGNQMLYTILDITDQAIKDELADCCDHQSFIARAPLVLIFLADCRRWLDAYAVAGCTPRAPGPGDLYIALCDALIAAQNAVTAAHALGLGSCYIGDIVEQRERLSALLALDQYTFPATLVVFGYPTAQQLRRRKPRRFDERFVVLPNRYRRLTPEEQRAAFAGRGDDFDAYLPAFCRRKYHSDFAAEMNRCVAAYLEPFGRTPEAPASQ